MAYGVVYVAHNPRDGSTIFKIGKTERPVDGRMKELTAATSNLGQYAALAYFVVWDIDAAEQACHKRLNRYRVQSNREFFDIPLERLLAIVRESVATFAARDFLPDLAQGSETQTANQSPAQLLAAARDRNTARESERLKALAVARRIAESSSAQIIKRANDAARELANEDLLRWEIAKSETFANPRYPVNTICSVLVLSRFSKSPLGLMHSGIRGGIHGDLDLSKAIEPAEVWHKAGNSEFLRWKERDDGRVGRISLSVAIAIRNAHDSSRESVAIPFVQYTVRATPITYDDYHQHFEEKYHKERHFKDATEAFEVFIALVIENVAKPLQDVRREGGYARSRHGQKRLRIDDRGTLLVSGLEE